MPDIPFDAASTPLVIWILAGVIVLLAGVTLALFRVVWKRILRRPEEVLAAATADATRGDKVLHRRVSEVTAEHNQVVAKLDGITAGIGELRTELATVKTEVRQ